MVGFLVLLLCSAVLGYAPLKEPGPGFYNEAFLQDAMERMNRDLTADDAFFDLRGNNKDDGLAPFLPGRAKDAEYLNNLDYDMLLSGHDGGVPSIRDQEYLQHSSLFGSGNDAYQKIKGGEIQKEVKTDSVLPAYCNPPNPCPVGYTAEDGCLEEFENTAAFSRAFQASQDCMCDDEHMFDCPGPRDNDIKMESRQDFIANLQGEHKNLVAKKFYNKVGKEAEEELSGLYAMPSGVNLEKNPFLQGEKLPIAAKKGQHTPHD